jgi:predicted permease
MGSLLRRVWFLLRHSRRDAELREEIETHRVLRQDRLERDGLPRAVAEPASRRALGNVTLAREDARQVWIAAAIDAAWQDLRIVMRGLRKSPVFSCLAIGTLALGIGANTALFSIFNSLLLRTLPVRDPGSLVLLGGDSWTYPIWEAIDRDQARVFDGAYAWANARFDLSGGGQTAMVDGAYVSGRSFDVLGVVPARGRLLAAGDDRRGADTAVAVISHRFWQQHFGSASSAVGSSIALERVPFTIVGIMPAGFAGPDVGRVADVIVPFAAEPLIHGQGSMLAGRSVWWIEIMARLKPGQTIEQANAALRSLQPRIREATLPANPRGYLEDPFALVPASTGTSELRGRFETPLRAMIGAVAVVLLIACANLANLLLARALVRRRELAVRLALGASRWRVARLLLIESLAISLAGAALGLLFATWSSALLVRQFGSWRGAVVLDLPLDWRVLGFTTALACLTAIVAGLAPALGIAGVAPGDAMRDAGRTIAGDRRLSIRGGLVVAQIALSLVLLVGAGLFLRTFTALSRLPLGFDPAPLTVVTLNLGSSTVDADGRPALLDRIRAAVSAAPGVRSAAMSVITPITGSGWNGGVGPRRDPPDRSQMTWLNAVTPDWFRTMGVRVLDGRDFDDRDRAGGVRTAVVNETFARRFLENRPPVGQTVRVGGPSDQLDYQVVGLVSDAVYRSLREGMVPTIYLPLAQEDRIGSGITLVAAAAPGARASADRSIAAALGTVDPALAFTFQNFDEFIHGAMTQERLVAMLSGFFGGLAVLLAAIGLYGVVSHSVSVRRTEIGVRMALGANAAGIVALIFRRVGALLAIGVVIGTTLSVWASTFVQSLLFRLDAQDPATVAGAVAVLVAAIAVAAWIPARRAARVDPARVLREG